MAEIARVGGWDLALAVELNGAPGPVPLLELADDLELDADQRVAIAAIHDTMRVDAIAAGERLIAAERALDAAFTDAVPGGGTLDRLVAEAGAARAAVRLVHLSAHLKTVPSPTSHQITRHAVLRGYANDPCDAVPEGHDAAMWRRHDGCG